MVLAGAGELTVLAPLRGLAPVLLLVTCPSPAGDSAEGGLGVLGRCASGGASPMLLRARWGEWSDFPPAAVTAAAEEVGFRSGADLFRVFGEASGAAAVGEAVIVVGLE